MRFIRGAIIANWELKTRVFSKEDRSYVWVFCSRYLSPTLLWFLAGHALGPLPCSHYCFLSTCWTDTLCKWSEVIGGERDLIKDLVEIIHNKMLMTNWFINSSKEEVVLFWDELVYCQESIVCVSHEGRFKKMCYKVILIIQK